MGYRDRPTMKSAIKSTMYFHIIFMEICPSLQISVVLKHAPTILDFIALLIFQTNKFNMKYKRKITLVDAY